MYWQVGTLEYMSPEVLQKQPYSFAADVYAWAVTVNEIATGVVPFSDCTKDNPQCHTVLNFGYGRCDSLLSTHICSLLLEDGSTVYPARCVSRPWGLSRPHLFCTISSLATVRHQARISCCSGSRGPASADGGKHASSAAPAARVLLATRPRHAPISCPARACNTSDAPVRKPRGAGCWPGDQRHSRA